VYNTSSILVREINDMIAWGMHVFNFSAKRTVYMANFLLITKHGQMEWAMIILLLISTNVVTIAWSIALENAGIVYNCSHACLMSWRYCNATHMNRFERLQFLKFKKACKSLKIRIGNYSYARKGKFMLYLFSVSKGTLETVLTFR